MGVTLKHREKLEMFSKVTYVLNTLKSYDALPGALVQSYKELFDVQAEMGSSPIEQASLSQLSKLCRTNLSKELLGLTAEEHESNLLSIEHAILMNHQDGFVDLTMPKISNFVTAFGKLRI